ncbi:MAG: hypothetical protein IPM82_29000 [Saprospiraceae bacterium]|nr:hypothetical protein [Saprospiraceae bacterium]
MTQEQYADMEEQMKQEPRAVQTFMDEMERGISKNQLESYFGEHIQDFSLSDEKYFQLISYYFLKGNLNEYQQFLLETYTVLQSVTKKMPNELWFVGMKDGMKGTVGDNLGIVSGTITGIIIPPGAISLKLGAGVLTAFAVKAGTATLVELALKWFRKIIQNQNLSMNLNQILSNSWQRKKLGDDFDKSYPLHGFEELITPLSKQ